MIYDRTEQNPGARFLLMAASAIVLIWGLQFARPVLLPFALALFLAVITLPIVSVLRGRGLPTSAAILVAVLLVVGVVSLLVVGAGRALTDLQASWPRYWNRLQEVQASWAEALEERLGTDGLGLSLDDFLPLNLVDPAAVLDFVGGTLQLGAALAAQAVIVILVMAFILAETTVLPDKLEAILGDGITGEERLQKVVREIQEYLGIKTVVSVLTGLTIGGWAWFMGLDFPVLLGVIGFILNYIPTVGSIIASVPGIALSLVLVGTLGHALVVALGYFVINTVFGSILEPNLMGRRLGLSTLVVILSLLFWGWTWGPIGALLSVPLTMVVKIFFENTRDLRWVAILLDKKAPAQGLAVPGPGGTPDPVTGDPGEVRAPSGAPSPSTGSA